jgi:hypothetical protein
MTHFTGARENRDTAFGAWRPLNLERAPFDFQPPLRTVLENCSESGGEYADKALAVWAFADLHLAG